MSESPDRIVDARRAGIEGAPGSPRPARPDAAASPPDPGAPSSDGPPSVRLDPVGAADLPTVAGWLGRKENYRWLHFGPGRQRLDEVTLKFMLQRDLHLLRTYRPAGHDGPVGLVALSDVDRDVGTASVWYVLGDKRFGGRGHTTRAVARLLGVAFEELGLESVFAWTVDTNRPSRRLLRRLGFRPAGRRRRCHRIDGVVRDRLLFDLLAREFTGRAPEEGT